MPRTPDLAQIARLDGRYDVEAFRLLGEGLRHAVRKLGRESATGPDRHVSASELLAGVADLAAERFGLLAGIVLRDWGIRRGEDLGEMTFALIEHGVFHKQPGDRIEDFSGCPALATLVEERVRARLVAG
jgi:uncharacterized repeat protein (TIGR04138 family)